MSIKVEHISKYIGRTQILSDISFSIEDCGVIGLLGPNGAGKSTLMKCMVGLWDFQSGEIEVCGIKASAKGKGSVMPHQVTEHIGYLPEQNPLYEDMYVREYLMFMASLRSKDKKLNAEKVEDICQAVGLNKNTDKLIRELSKGYKQRVGLAQAMLGDPQVLILDEPTTGFDPNQLEDIRALIKELGKNKIIFLSTHILQEVEAMCNRVIILADGQIREDTTDLSDLETLFKIKTKG
ncbi:MAG: ATP-binding cassette domain-containing protein [Paludibacteraceae bacterium]|nr:ATP-binding cassette domain-containing protein [Paludibacteraceae bacterium]